jgi:hypothetical protein
MKSWSTSFHREIKENAAGENEHVFPSFSYRICVPHNSIDYTEEIATQNKQTVG